MPGSRDTPRGRRGESPSPLHREVEAATPLQQKKRQLVRQEIARAAWLLFAERGYEQTTVEATKEDVVVGTSDALAEDFLAAFVARPAHEPPVLAIQKALRPVVESWLTDTREMDAIIRLLRESRTLRRAMLERHARMEERLAGLIAERTGADPDRDPTPALLAFVARALMDAAFNVWFDQRPKRIGPMVDDLFVRLRRAILSGSTRQG
jgi:AcrR family transcriptional regulator